MSKETERAYGAPFAALFLTLVAQGVDSEIALAKMRELSNRFGNHTITERTLLEVAEWIRDNS
jgi:hypothetical protein